MIFPEPFHKFPDTILFLLKVKVYFQYSDARQEKKAPLWPFCTFVPKTVPNTMQHVVLFTFSTAMLLQHCFIFLMWLKQLLIPLSEDRDLNSTEPWFSFGEKISQVSNALVKDGSHTAIAILPFLWCSLSVNVNSPIEDHVTHF